MNTTYRFNNEIDKETGEEKHLHEGFKDDKWLPRMGVSTVSKRVVNKSEYFNWWASRLACEEFGFIKPLPYFKKPSKADLEKHEKMRVERAEAVLAEIRSMSPSQFIKKLEKAYRAHKDSLKASGEAGTDLHKELEKFVKSRMGKNTETVFHPRIKPFIDWADLNVKRFIASEAHCYSDKYWTGGITDVIAELHNGTCAVIDFKSGKEAYIDYLIQGGGYMVQIEENGICDSTGKHYMKLDKPITQFIVVPFGASRVSPIVFRKVDELKRIFTHAVEVYKFIEFFHE